MPRYRLGRRVKIADHRLFAANVLMVWPEARIITTHFDDVVRLQAIDPTDPKNLREAKSGRTFNMLIEALPSGEWPVAAIPAFRQHAEEEFLRLALAAA